jgi:hypothetical protein
MTGAPVVIEVEGADEVARRLGVLSRQIDDLHRPFADVADQIAGDGRAFAPKRSGRLAGGIVGSATERGGGATIYGVPYAGVINFGWAARGIAGALFMQRAADSKGPAAADQVAGEIQRDVNKDGLG